MDVLTGLSVILRRQKTREIVFFLDTNLFLIISEDIDPTVGKFRNMIQTTLVIPNKVWYCSFEHDNYIQLFDFCNYLFQFYPCLVASSPNTSQPTRDKYVPFALISLF